MIGDLFKPALRLAATHIATFRIVYVSITTGERDVICRALQREEADSLLKKLSAKHPDCRLLIEDDESI